MAAEVSIVIKHEAEIIYWGIFIITTLQTGNSLLRPSVKCDWLLCAFRIKGLEKFVWTLNGPHNGSLYFSGRASTPLNESLRTTRRTRGLVDKSTNLSKISPPHSMGRDIAFLFCLCIGK